MRYTKYISLLFVIGELASAGSKGNAPVIKATTPRPARGVFVREVGTLAFPLPNGTNVDLSMDLKTMFQSAVTENSNLQPLDDVPNEDCSEHTEVRANISTLEMKIAEFNLRVGYTPAGSIPVPATAIDGSINVNLGAIAMDFQIYKCVREQANGKKQCWMVGAKSVNQNLFKSKINFNANFGQITTSASFLSNTPMGALIRQMMVQGVVQLYQDPSYNELPWKAVIEEIDVQNGYVFFSKGIEDRVATAQTFTVFSQVKGAGACSYWRPLANILTTDVYTVSSRARIDQLLDSAHPVQQGDIVMIRSVTPR